jgi:regulator of protease activity HflC (stomatin/prohibitin superfamily)
MLVVMPLSIVLAVVSRIVILIILGSILSAFSFFTSIILFCGLRVVGPNEGRIIMFCGKYKGTIRENGLLFVNPFYSKSAVYFKSNIFETDILKVNDLKGNPIQIGAVIVWKIQDSAKALFEVANLMSYVTSQSETAVRKVASSYPYDHIEEGDISLKDGGEIINNNLVHELQQRLSKAGVLVEEARLNRLNYSEEIAQVMLRRQQAESIISARHKIINGAVGIVAMALDSLKNNNICELTKEERARLTSNLLVVLCSESQVNPVVNTGSV